MSEEADDEVDFTPKLNCGVWTAIENFINKENNEMIWDNKIVPPKVSVARKKERTRVRKTSASTPLISMTPRRGSSSARFGLSSIREELANDNADGISSANISPFAAAFAHKALVIRKTRNEHAEEVFERSKQMLDKYNISTIDCSFNLPRVNAQLERLMGSNVVHLTDRKYMTELRRRITDDFQSTLMKRINQRKAEEIQRQRILLMEGKLLKCPKELRNHPVLAINESTNNFVIKRRAKLKTERERVAERMIRLGKKWEAEHQQWEVRERQQEAEMRVKEMELLASDKNRCLGKLEKGNRGGGGGGGRAEKIPRKGEMNMDNFLKKERQLMLTRLKPKDKKFIPFTKDLRIVDANRRMSEVSIQKLKSIVAKVRAPNTVDGASDGSSDAAAAEFVANAAIEDSIPIDFRSKRRNTKVLGMFEFLKSTFKKFDDQKKSEEKSGAEDTQSSSQDELIETRDIFVDPVIKKLKEAKNVLDLYHVAEKIIGINIENILDKSKSECEDPVS